MGASKREFMKVRERPFLRLLDEIERINLEPAQRLLVFKALDRYLDRKIRALVEDK